MIKRTILVILILLISSISFGGTLPTNKARKIKTDVGDFGVNISTNANTVQKALKEVNNLSTDVSESTCAYATGCLALDCSNDPLLDSLEILLKATSTRGIKINGDTNDYTTVATGITLELIRDLNVGTGDLSNYAGIQNNVVPKHTNANVAGTRYTYGIINKINDDSMMTNNLVAPFTYQYQYGSYNHLDNNSTMDTSNTGENWFTWVGVYSRVDANPTITDTGENTPLTQGVACGVDIDVNLNTNLVSGQVHPQAVGLRIDVDGATEAGASASVARGIQIDGVSGCDSNYGIWDNSGADWVLDSDNQKIYFGEWQEGYITYTGDRLSLYSNSGLVEISTNASVTGDLTAEGALDVEGALKAANLMCSDYIGQWRMNDNVATTTVVDTTGVNDGVAQQNTEDITTTGKINKALTFNGTSDRIDIGANGVFDSEFADNWTFAFWVKRTGAANQQMIFNKYYKVYAQCLTGKLNVNVYDKDDNSTGDTNMGDIPLNVWTHIVVTYGSDIVTAHINGAYSDEFAAVGPLTIYSNNLRIGHYNNNLYFEGIIDDLRVYDYVLSSGEIEAIYNEGNGFEESMLLVVNDEVIISTDTVNPSQYAKFSWDGTKINMDLTGDLNIGDTGGFSGMKFESATTRLVYWIDGSSVSYITATGEYVDLTP